MLKEKEKRPNNKREDEVKTFKIGHREDAIWKERRAKLINGRLYMIHDSHWDLSNCGTLPYVKSFFYPGGWYEEKCTYG